MIRSPTCRSRNSQRGSVMVLIMTILAALMAGAGVALYLQLTSTRASGMAKATRSAMYCAEAGLVASRGILGNSYQLWNTWLDPNQVNPPVPVYPISQDIDGDGVADFIASIRDNDDELPGNKCESPPNTACSYVDNDLRIFIVSECIKYSDVPQKVMELVTYKGGGNSYAAQKGEGGLGSGNQN